MLGPFQVVVSASASLPFQCALYRGPSIPGFDSKQQQFYSFAGTSLILPVAFAFSSVAKVATLEVPLWTRTFLHDTQEYSLLPVASTIPAAPSITLKHFSALSRPFRHRVAWEEVLPEVLTARRPLCRGCVVPVSVSGHQFLLQVDSSSVEEELFFTFDLSAGELHFERDPKDTHPSTSFDLELIRLQMKMLNSRGNLFLLTGVPFLQQEAVFGALGVEKRVNLLKLIPEEPFELDDLDDASDDASDEFYALPAVELLNEALLESVLKKHRGSDLIFTTTSTKSIDSRLDRLAGRFNFTLWRHEFPAASQDKDPTKLLLTTPCRPLQAPRSKFFGFSALRSEFLKFFLNPLQNRSAFQALGLPSTPPGILLYGPPGSGKSAFLHSLLADPQITAHYTVLHVRSGSELLSKYLGGTESNIRALFTQARACTPCIIFLDQIQSLAPTRSHLDSESGGSSKQRYLSTLLNEMDGIGGREGVTVVATCLEPGELDEAIIRPGRLEKHVRMPLPSPEDCAEIVKGYSSGDQLVDDGSLAAGLTPSEIICKLKEL